MAKAIYGLLGRRLQHSWSVPIHQALGCTEYRLIEREPEELEGFFNTARIGGLNVTIPYKQAVMAYCDVIDGAALAIGSVNTLSRRADGKLYAWNTDIIGFRYMAKQAGISLKDQKVLILGSGGASLTVQQAAREAGARTITVVSRGKENSYENLSLHFDAEVLINTTPVGMYPHNGEALLDLIDFPQCRGVLDLIYNPLQTNLLIQAKKRGIACSGGLPMLVSQAAAAEKLFFERPVPESETKRILSLIRRDMTNIVLIGMPGSGKSTIGKALADLTGRDILETDEMVVKKAGQSIPQIFRSEGEGAFRSMEREAAARAGKEAGRIIVTGGGIVKDMGNYDPLHQNGRIYEIKRPIEQLAREGRPLSEEADLAQMQRQRAPLYETFRDCVIKNNESAKTAAHAVWREFNAYFSDQRPQS